MKSSDSSQVEWIAHRGSSQLAPENTLAAFRLGWQETMTCELDIQPTGDGKLLVIHDASTKRTTGVDRQVADCPMSELQELDAGFQDARWKGEKLPSLEAAIAEMPVGKRLLIEIKAGPEVVPELERVIRASGKEDQVLLQSFDFTCCVAARKAFPALPVYWLGVFAQDRPPGEWACFIDDRVEKARESAFDGLALNDTPLMKAADVEKIHAAGLNLAIWTVDEVGNARRLIDLGVKTIITNRPGWLKAQLSRDE